MSWFKPPQRFWQIEFTPTSILHFKQNNCKGRKEVNSNDYTCLRCAKEFYLPYRNRWWNLAIYLLCSMSVLFCFWGCNETKEMSLLVIGKFRFRFRYAFRFRFWYYQYYLLHLLVSGEISAFRFRFKLRFRSITSLSISLRVWLNHPHPYFQCHFKWLALMRQSHLWFFQLVIINFRFFFFFQIFHFFRYFVIVINQNFGYSFLKVMFSISVNR